MIIGALLLSCALLQTQDEKKPAPAPAPQERPLEETPLPKALSDESPVEKPGEAVFLPGFRIGGWWMPTFDARTSAGGRKIQSTLFFDAGLDLRVEYGGWSLALTADYAAAEDVTVQMGGLLLGKCWQLASESPFYLQVSAGPIFGRLDVRTSAFGDFKSGAGGEARLSATVEVHERIELQLWLDYRQITFKYDEPVVSGDRKAGGATFSLGAGFLMRF